MPRLAPLPSQSDEQVDARRQSLIRDITCLSELRATRGWAVIEEKMREELIAASLLLARNAPMTKDEIDFRRGAIWAASELLELPARLIQRLENDLLFLPQSPANTQE